MGHENRDRGTRHAKQLIEDVAWGRLWTRKIGLGSEFLANFSDSENRPTKAALVLTVIGIKLVGANGFEPSTSCSRSRRASQAALRPDRTT